MSRQLKIVLDDKDGRLDADVAIATLENTLEVLRTIEKTFPRHDDTIHWDIVSAKMESPLTFALAPRATGIKATRTGEEVASACVTGLRMLEREAKTPPHFDDDSLEAAKRLATIVRDSRQKLTLSVPRATPAVPTEQIISHVREIEEKARVFIEYATIEGQLEEVSVHETDHVNLWETLTGFKIECRVTADLLEQAKTVLGRRVALSGRLRYRNNRPRLMIVESMRILREQKDLPQPKSIRPINITHGESSEEFVRRLRDAE